MTQTQRLLKIIPGLLVSGLALIWLFFAVEWGTVLQHLKETQPQTVGFALVALLVHYVLRAQRWKYLLPAPGDRTPTRILFDALGISNLCNYLLPLRAGEIARAWFLARLSPLSMGQSFSSVIIERLFDLTTVLLSFLALVMAGSHFNPYILLGAKTLASLAGLLFLGLMAGTFLRAPLMRCAHLLSKAIPFLPESVRSVGLTFLEEVCTSAMPLTRNLGFFKACLLSIAVWGSNYVCIYFLLMACGVPVSPVMAVTVGVVLALAVAAPAAPGFLGAYQWACIVALAMFDITTELATAFALVSHALQYVLYLLYGAYLLMRYQLRFSMLVRLGMKDGSHAAPA